jgi:hypothetical protein
MLAMQTSFTQQVVADRRTGRERDASRRRLLRLIARGPAWDSQSARPVPIAGAARVPDPVTNRADSQRGAKVA